MKAKITVQFSLGADTYNVNLTLPETTPTADKPFLFGVEKVEAGASEDPLLQVAIGAKEQFYVAVQPPKSLMKEAGIDNVVKELQVEVAEGEYNVASKQFKTTPVVSDSAG